MGTHTPDTTTTTKVNKTGSRGREGQRERENENTANEVISNFLFYFSAMRANYCRCCFVFFSLLLVLLLRLLLRWPVLCDDCPGIGQNVACDDNILVQLGH